MAESGPRDVAIWLQRWRDRLGAGAVMPEDEARLVIEAVLEDLRGGHQENLDRAGRAWGRAHRSVSEMVGRLSSFREAMAASGVENPLQMHRALDRVTTAATEEVLHRLERASRTDALTGVGNRRAFDETLSAALSAASRQGHEVTVVAVDLDGLKRINDTEGHAAGDAALLAIVRAFYSALRDEDTVFRVGGDEFVILLPFTSVDAAELLMERIRVSGAPAFTWGAAGYPGDGSEARGLVEAADHELYRRRQARRLDRLVPVPVPDVEPEPTGRMDAERPASSGRQVRAVRWAWIPAAMILLGSLVATLVSATSGPVSISAGRHAHPSTQPKNGGTPSPPGGQRSGGSTAPGSGSGGSGGARTATVGFTSPASGTAPSSSPPPPGTQPPPSPPPPGQGGVLGLLENLLAPVPVVGGSNGLLAVVGQVVAGPTTTTTAPVTSAAVPVAAPAGGGLFQVVQGLAG